MNNRQSETDKPKPTQHIEENTVPFGAKGILKDGNPYYGEGLHGWIRKTYGDLFHPAKRLNNPDEEDWDKYNKVAQRAASMVDTKLNWDAWGEKVFGLSAKEAGNAIAAIIAPGSINKANLQEQVDAGEITQFQAGLKQTGEGIAQAVNMTKDLAQRGIWGALEILGLTDVGMTKVWSIRMGLDQMADKYGTADANTFGSYLNTFGTAKDWMTVGGAVIRGEVTTEQVFSEVFKKNWEGSNAIYTMMADESVRKEFERRVNLGEDKGRVAAELGNAWIELGGSILGDPSTYLGMGIIKPKLVTTPMKLFGKEIALTGKIPSLSYEVIGKLPTFGELVGLKKGAAGLRAAGENVFFKYANDDLARAVKQAFDAGDDNEVMKLLDEGIRKFISPEETAVVGNNISLERISIRTQRGGRNPARSSAILIGASS